MVVPLTSVSLTVSGSGRSFPLFLLHVSLFMATVPEWLGGLGLLEYLDLLSVRGFRTIKDCVRLGETDMVSVRVFVRCIW